MIELFELTVPLLSVATPISNKPVWVEEMKMLEGGKIRVWNKKVSQTKSPSHYNTVNSA